LPGEFVLLCGVWFDEGHGRHVLDYEEAELVAGAVEEGGFDFYLFRAVRMGSRETGGRGERK
jgi:hypothetical protein